MEMTDSAIDYVYRDNIITKDGITYDLRDSTQKDAYDEAYDETNGWMNKLILCVNSSNAHREYKSSNLSSTPTHPNRNDFGYENLCSGSTCLNISTGEVYMFDEKSGPYGEWILL